MRVVVVGAGVLGAALARTLAQQNHEVALVEQFDVGDPRAASHACTRILRLAHGEDVADTRSAWLARRLWKELEHESGRSLFAEVGMAWLAGQEVSWEAAGAAVLKSQGIEVARLSPAEAGRMLPGLLEDDLDHVLFEPQAGLLRAAEALQALVASAVEAGASVVRGRASPDGSLVLVDDRRLEAERIVWACGAWTPSLFPELVRGSVIQQDVCYFEVGDELSSPPAPAWGEWSRSATGSGDLGRFGFKVGLDRSGPSIDLDAPVRTPVAEHESDVRTYLAHRFPRLTDAPLIRTETCQTVALDPGVSAAAMLGGEVRLLRHPDYERVWLLGDGSGHAFKHAPAIAADAATMLTSA